MIVVDTNVVSELTKRSTQVALPVLTWFQRLDPDLIYLTTTTLAELWSGVAAMPDGARKQDLANRVDRVVSDAFLDRVLPFDVAAARSYAIVLMNRRQAGLGYAPMDLQIAAIAHANDMAVATRNVRDFERCGVRIVDPWQVKP